MSEFNVGDKVTINRGKNKDSVAEVIAVNESKNEYGVKLPDGSFAVIASATVKREGTPTLKAPAFAEVANEYVGQLPDGFLAGLEARSPGFTAGVRVAEASGGPANVGQSIDQV